jgi:hypothetical protein
MLTLGAIVFEVGFGGVVDVGFVEMFGFRVN